MHIPANEPWSHTKKYVNLTYFTIFYGFLDSIYYNMCTMSASY